MSQIRDLPDGWQKELVKNIAHGIQYGYTESSSKENIGPKFLRITDIQENKINWENVPYCSIEEEQKIKYVLEDGDLVFARTGATVGKSFLIKGNIPETVFASYLIRLRFPKTINGKYVWYYFQSPFYWQQINDNQVGTGQPNVNGTRLGGLEIIIPRSLAEQNRIVAKIEELFSSLDKGIESLKTAQTQLKTYRQAVLKWAFEGKLTEEWRKENSRGGAERAERKDLTKPAERAKEGELPEGWKWVMLANLVEKISDGPFGSNLKTSDYIDRGIRVIRLENIGELVFKNEYKSFVTENKYETIKNHTVAKGDIIFSSFISENIRATILPDYIDNAINKADCFLVRSNKEKVSNKYLVYYFASRSMYFQLVGNIHGATRPRINTSQLKTTQIPAAPFKEQQAIVSEIETRLSVCDKMEESIAQSLTQAEALRQSILKKAFEGKLVPQDPNDEPASVLLERIRKERALAANSAVTKRKATMPRQVSKKWGSK